MTMPAARIAFAAIFLASAAVAAGAQTKAPPPSQVAPRPLYPLPPPEPPVVTLPNGRDVPARIDTFSDKATRCLHYATSIGVPRDQLDDYMKRCTIR
jgi:hypothetical protein